MQQLDKAPDAAPQANFISITQPQASKLYYYYCGKIDQHNRTRQDELGMEKKIRTHDWSKRVNLGIFAMCVVDAYYLTFSAQDKEDGKRTGVWHLMSSFTGW